VRLSAYVGRQPRRIEVIDGRTRCVTVLLRLRYLTATRVVRMFTAMRWQIKCLPVRGGAPNTLEVNRLSRGFLRASHLERIVVADHAHCCSPCCTTTLSAPSTAVIRKRIAAAYGLRIKDTKVTLGAKNNMEIEYGRIGWRRFWAPSYVSVVVTR
jgi:hypothetical protein